MVAERRGARKQRNQHFADYRPIDGAADELFDKKGGIRPAWKKFVDHFSQLSEEEIVRRFARGDQHLRDAGVFFRQYQPGGSAERAWPLSHVPVILDDAEWEPLSEGLIQRAELLEAVAADLYGPQKLVKEGFLPASLIAASQEWLRPLVGVTPPSGYFIHFIAFDLGRGPDGSWWVLSDRTQAPSGVGFALENRIATTRVFPDKFGRDHVHRLAGFFRRFREALFALREDSDSRLAILTPGLLNDSYFEHAYIARYLGFMLLEGEDLTVQNGRVMVRTVEGLSPVSVLWRRLDAAFADPLELNDASRLGTPGLVSAVRSGSLSMVNALGTGVLEARALLAFLPRIAKHVLGEPLAIPNVATWWCGQDAERAHVRQNAQRMVIGRALSTRPLFEADLNMGRDTYFGEGPDFDRARFDREGPFLVGQEAVKLSTTPVMVDGKLVPRPMSVRIFLARTKDGWEVMRGGYARIGESANASALSLQQGGSVADVWIKGGDNIDGDTMMPSSSDPFLRAEPGILPSRAADNLYWLGRYVERAEFIMRLVRAYNLRLLETDVLDAPLMTLLTHHLEGFGVDTEEGVPQGLIDALEAAIGSAGRVRDRFAIDGWMALNDLKKTALEMQPRVQLGDDAAGAMGVLLRKITGFSGLVHENMYRVHGWRFLSLGQDLERVICTAEVLGRFADPKSPDGGLDLAVEAGDSIMAHRQRFSLTTNRATVIDLLAMDARNPRSMLYLLNEVKELVEGLPGTNVNGQLSPLARAVLRAQADLAVETATSLKTSRLLQCRDWMMDISNHLTQTYMR